ncbi:MAG TPA: helix-turn-helix domain-containing protein, partial [Negativicutes bacterium]|nr:helix-turn-helix domain-containing protein [Negativicutes bacterium]
AYEYFSYAKEAISLGVHDYLLKPINRGKVVETIEGICANIASKREAVQREMQLKEKMNKVIPHLEGQFIYSQLLDGNTSKDAGFYEEVFGMGIRYGYVMMALLEENEGKGSQESMKDSLDRQRLYDVFTYELKNLCKCLVGPPMLDKISAYIPADQRADTYETRNKAIDIATKLIDKINSSVDIKYRIGIGCSYDLNNFTRSYNEAHTAASIKNGDYAVHFEDIMSMSGNNDIYPESQEKELVRRLLSFDAEGAESTFESIFLWLTMNYKEDIDRIKSRMIELFFQIKRTIPYFSEEDSLKAGSFLNDVLKLQDIRELKVTCTNNLKHIIEDISNAREKEINSLSRKVKKYLAENFHRDISMDDAAKETNLSYHYFSKFFKDSMGKSFVEYLTELRVDKSRELLRDTNDSIKEICYKIGYSDPNYYCKIFKKVTGMTPTEFRENQQAGGVMDIEAER